VPSSCRLAPRKRVSIVFSSLRYRNLPLPTIVSQAKILCGPATRR
jgi:hypothetical protein